MNKFLNKIFQSKIFSFCFSNNTIFNRNER